MYSNQLILLLSKARLYTMKSKLVYRCIKYFSTLNLHNALLVCSGTNLFKFELFLANNLIHSFMGVYREDSQFATGIFSTTVHTGQKV